MTWVIGRSNEEFTADAMLLAAVVRELTVIGEAVKHLPAELRNTQPGVPWASIAGLRDVIVHGYFALQEDSLWIVANERIPELREAVALMLDPSPQP